MRPAHLASLPLRSPPPSRCDRVALCFQQAGGGAVNVQGEEQKKLDVISNDVLKNALRSTGEKI